MLCALCRRQISSETSIALGVGPTCAAKLGLAPPRSASARTAKQPRDTTRSETLRARKPRRTRDQLPLPFHAEEK